MEAEAEVSALQPPPDMDDAATAASSDAGETSKVVPPDDDLEITKLPRPEPPGSGCICTRGSWQQW